MIVSLHGPSPLPWLHFQKYHHFLYYRKSSINPPGRGAYLFQVHLREAYLRGGGGLFNSEKSALHKELEYKVENLKYKTVGGHAAEDQNQIRTSSW